MPITRNMMGVGLPGFAAQAIVGTLADGLTATGTTQATAFQVSTDRAIFSTVAAGGGARLPQGGENDKYTVINDGANALLLYPPVGGTISGGAVNAALSVAVGQSVNVFYQDYQTIKLDTVPYIPGTSYVTTSALAASNGSSLAGYTVGRASAIAADVEEKLQRFVDLEDYMTASQRTNWRARLGTEDMQSAFAAVIADANGVPTKCMVPAGKGRIDSAVSASGIGSIKFEGQGKDITEIVVNFASGDAFTFGDGATLRSHLGMSGMTISSGVTRTADAHIKVNHCALCDFSDLRISGAFYGFDLVDSQLTVISDAYILDTVATTGECIRANATGAVNHSGSNLFIVRVATDATGTQPRCGLSVKRWDGLWLLDSQFNHSGTGFFAEPTSGTFFDHIFATNCSFDTGSGNGFITQGAGVVRRGSFTNCWFGTNDNTGITLGSATLSMHFCNSRIVNNGTIGVNVTSATDWSFVGGLCSGNSRTSSGTYSGFNVANNMSIWKIALMTIQAAGGFSDTQNYGIEVGSSCSQVVIIGNTVRTNVNGAISNANTTNITIIGNDGYVTANKGTGTVASGGTVVGVTHGLSYTPALEDITVTMTNFSSAAKIRIASPSSSGFNVHTDVDPTGSGQTFVWSAKGFQ